MIVEELIAELQKLSAHLRVVITVHGEVEGEMTCSGTVRVHTTGREAVISGVED